MLKEHTPEPWHVDSRIHIKSENGWRVATVNVPNGSIGSWGVSPSDNARRIVACVNALAGISTEDIQALPQGELARLIQEASDA